MPTNDTHLADRELIRELQFTYGYRLDDGDWDRFRDVFTDDVELDYGSQIGRYEGRSGVDEFIEWCADSIDASTHAISNPVIDVNGDEATGRWYVNAHSFFADGTMGITRGEYRNEYRRTATGWRISSLTLRLFSRLNVTEDGIDDLERLDTRRGQ